MIRLRRVAGVLERILKITVDISAGTSAVIVFVMMFPITLDVILRYVFNKPLHGTYQLAEFMMVGAVYLSIAYVQAHREHIKLEVATNRLSPRMQMLLDIIGHWVGIGIFAIITWQAGKAAWETWRIGDYTMGIVEWPLWPAKTAVAFGCGLLVLQLLADSIHDTARLVGLSGDPDQDTLQEGNP
ncbi:MAG: TRAP transporter small permease [bacterium]